LGGKKKKREEILLKGGNKKGEEIWGKGKGWVIEKREFSPSVIQKTLRKIPLHDERIEGENREKKKKVKEKRGRRSFQEASKKTGENRLLLVSPLGGREKLFTKDREGKQERSEGMPESLSRARQ